jgi:membrane-associated protein
LGWGTDPYGGVLLIESFILFICEHATYAPYIFFGLIMLSGFNIPISEELMILIAGALGSICGHETNVIIYLYVWVFFACWLSAWEAYWLGRWLGPKLFTLKWFRHIITETRLKKFGHYIERFGVFAFLIGRFIPCGVRNTLFMTSGVIKMPFGLFLMRDFGACLLACSTWFYLGHLFGGSYKVILEIFKVYEKILLVGIILFVICLGIYIYKQNRVLDKIEEA